MKKFIFTRTAIVLETFEIMAEDEWAAGEQLKVGPAPVSSEFVDWYTDDFVLEDGMIPSVVWIAYHISPRKSLSRLPRAVSCVGTAQTPRFDPLTKTW